MQLRVHPLSRFPELLCITRSPTTGGAYVPGDESRPTERTGERNPLAYATPLAVASRTKTPCAQPPAVPAAATAAAATASAAPDPRVLYVERGGDRRGAMQGLLAGRGWDTLEATMTASGVTGLGLG